VAHEIERKRALGAVLSQSRQQEREEAEVSCSRVSQFLHSLERGRLFTCCCLITFNKISLKPNASLKCAL
jgi:hypothetical protein